MQFVGMELFNHRVSLSTTFVACTNDYDTHEECFLHTKTFYSVPL